MLFFHNFLIIDIILMHSFLCMHHVGFNVSNLKVSWLFNCCDGGSNIKTFKTKKNGRGILEGMHANLLYFKVISHVNEIKLVECEIVSLFVFMGGRMTKKMLNLIRAL